jgi:hypothetical protein
VAVNLWVVDDGSVPDEAHIFRRLPDKPPFIVVPDALGGPKELGIAVYSYDDDDGMSVYSSTALDRESITHVELIDWTTKNLCVVPMTVVRRSLPRAEARPGTVSPDDTHEVPGGVVAAEVTHPTDPRIGRAHALMRIAVVPKAAKKVLKPAWNAFRLKLLDDTCFKTEAHAQWIRQPSREAPASSQG